MNIRYFKDRASRSLSLADYNPRLLATIHAGVALLCSLALTVLQYVLSHGIASTGGLSGMGTRAILSTLQTVLTIAATVLLPFWEIGFLRSSLLLAKRESAMPNSLTAGFRRLFPVLRLFLLQIALCFVLLLISSQVASMLYTMSPFGEELNTLMEPYSTDPEMLEKLLTDPELMAQLTPHMTPIYIIAGIIFLGLAIPVFYLLRFSRFAIMNDENPGALNAVRTSLRTMFRNVGFMLRVDLRFWWYYAAQILITLIAWLDVLLPLAGINLPFNADISFFLFYFIYLLASLALAWRFKAYVQTTYAHCYLHLQQTQ